MTGVQTCALPFSPNKNSVVVFSFIGFRSQEITIGNQSVIRVKLVEDTQKLEEVVVVGYGTQKKVTVTGAVASVTGEELRTSPTTNLSNGMIGRMPGVIGFQRSDEPGGGATTIRIRGTNSIGNKEPLVVIDGIPDRSGGLNRINPDEIESMSVLKDAAGAIYGSRSANGVILITTKRGKEGKPIVTFNGSYGYSSPTQLPQMCNAFDPQVRFRTFDDYAIMSMVESGLGLSILPELILRRNPYDIEVRHLEPRAFRTIRVVTRERGRLPIAARRFLSYLRFR